MTTNIVSQRHGNATVQQKRAQQTPTHKAWYRNPSKLTKIASLALASAAVLYALSRRSGVLEGDFTSSSDPVSDPVSMNSKTREKLSVKFARIIISFLTPELVNDPNLRKALNLQLVRVSQAMKQTATVGVDPSMESNARESNEEEVRKCQEELIACWEIERLCQAKEDDLYNKLAGCFGQVARNQDLYDGCVKNLDQCKNKKNAMCEFSEAENRT